jgi:hypothetical protein
VSESAAERAKVSYFRAQLKRARRAEEAANAALARWPDDKRIELEEAECAYRRARLELWLGASTSAEPER